MKNELLFEHMYKNWGEALGVYIEDVHGKKRGSRKWLAKLLLDIEDEAELTKDEEEKLASKASEIGRWINQGVTPITRTRKEVHNKLNICISKNSNGEWVISRTEKEKAEVSTEEINGEKSVKEAGDRLKTAIDQQGFPDIARAFLVEYFRERQENLSKELKRVDDLIEKLLSDSDD